MKPEDKKDFVTKSFEVNDDTIALVTEFAEQAMEEHDIPMKTACSFNIVIDELV